jgi:N-succinyldiaminopimelate aminotransferase
MSISAASRIASIPESIFATMSRLAVEHGAVNLGQGFPDFDGPAWIVEEAHAAMQAGKNQYAPMPGILSLRRAIAEYQKSFYGLAWNADDEITVTAGATEALFSTMLAFIDSGDEVILLEPFYDSHQANVILAGGVPKYVTLHAPDFHIDPDAIERVLTPSTRMLVLNNPDNPTGKVFTRDELGRIADIAIRNDLIVISDEVYEFLTYDAEHVPIATLPGMRERTVTISSTGKTFGMTGWKIGYTMAVPELSRAIRMVHQFVTFAVNTPGQHAMAAALSRLPEYLPELRSLYRGKRDMLFAGLKESVFTPHLPSGSYFIMADIPDRLGIGDVAAATRLVTEFGVAAIPPSAFYSESDEGTRMLRFCFAKTEATLRDGIARLRGARFD